MTKHPNNGPTFSKVPYAKRKPMTDADLAEYHARKEAEQEAIVQEAAKSRRIHHLILTDPVGFCQGRYATEFRFSKDK